MVITTYFTKTDFLFYSHLSFQLQTHGWGNWMGKEKTDQHDLEIYEQIMSELS